MYNDDIFSIIMAAEESMIKAQLGVEDSYEAYAMESAAESAFEESIAMETAYIDSYGWDTAMEDAATAIEDKTPAHLSIGEHKASLGEKLKAAGAWVKKGLSALWDKAVKLWQWLCDKVKQFLNWLFKRQKDIAEEEKATDNSGAGSDSGSNSTTTEVKPANGPKSIQNSASLSNNRANQPRLSDDHTRSDKGYFVSKKSESGYDDIYMAKSGRALEREKHEIPGLPDNKKFNKSLPSIAKRAEIMKANQENGVTANDISRVQKAADDYVKSLFQFISKSLDVARNSRDMMNDLRTLNWKTLEKDKKTAEFKNKFSNLGEKIDELDKFNAENGSYKSNFNEATKDVPHWSVYIEAKTIHGYTGTIRQIYEASHEHLTFCKAFKQFIEKHSDDDEGTAYKNPQALRLDGKTVSGGVVIGSTHTNLMYEGSKLYVRASTAVNKVVEEYTNLINRIIAA